MLVERQPQRRLRIRVAGPAQLHHCHWKCTVCYTETDAARTRRRVEVVYIDRDHLHLPPDTKLDQDQAFGP